MLILIKTKNNNRNNTIQSILSNIQSFILDLDILYFMFY